MSIVQTRIKNTISERRINQSNKHWKRNPPPTPLLKKTQTFSFIYIYHDMLWNTAKRANRIVICGNDSWSRPTRRTRLFLLSQQLRQVNISFIVLKKYTKILWFHPPPPSSYDNTNTNKNKRMNFSFLFIHNMHLWLPTVRANFSNSNVKYGQKYMKGKFKKTWILIAIFQGLPRLN